MNLQENYRRSAVGAGLGSRYAYNASNNVLFGCTMHSRPPSGMPKHNATLSWFL